MWIGNVDASSSNLGGVYRGYRGYEECDKEDKEN
jgi:hypothetical protein